MSEVLIRMEIPESCNECFVKPVFCPSIRGRMESDTAPYTWIPANYRHDDCPLIKVPHHGRMIDADALMLKIQDYIDEYSDLDEYGLHNFKWCAMKEVEMAINEANTIIGGDGHEN